MFEFKRCTVLQNAVVYYTASASPVKQNFTWEELEILKYLRDKNNASSQITGKITV